HFFASLSGSLCPVELTTKILTLSPDGFAVRDTSRAPTWPLVVGFLSFAAPPPFGRSHCAINQSYIRHQPVASTSSAIWWFVIVLARCSLIPRPRARACTHRSE